MVHLQLKDLSGTIQTEGNFNLVLVSDCNMAHTVEIFLNINTFPSSIYSSGIIIVGFFFKFYMLHYFSHSVLGTWIFRTNKTWVGYSERNLIAQRVTGRNASTASPQLTFSFFSHIPFVPSDDPAINKATSKYQLNNLITNIISRSGGNI